MVSDSIIAVNNALSFRDLNKIQINKIRGKKTINFKESKG